MTSEATTTYTLVGTVRDASAVPVGHGVAVEVVDLRLGGEHPIGFAAVGPDGTFALSYDPAAARSGSGASLDLVVRVVTPGAGGEVLARSATRFDAGPHERVDVILPAGTPPPAAEHTRLLADLTATMTVHAGPTMAALTDLQEEGEHGARRDVTFLAAKSGWDPRAVAMAVDAERDAAATDIPAPLHYALRRAGLPAEDRLWALVSAATLEEVWRRAAEQGIVEPDALAAIPAGLEAAARLGEEAVLALPTGVGESRFADLLPSSLGSADRIRFTRLYREHRGAPDALWSAAREELGEDTAARLRVTGELAALTRNNAALVARLHAEHDPGSAGELAAAGFHRADRWRAALTEDIPVPDEVAGADDAARRDAYAAALAAQMRARHPTAVLGAEVAEGIMPVGPDAGPAVSAFLADHHDRFDVTRHPVADYVDRRGIELAPAAQREIAAIQRVLAVAPTPQAARGLRVLGLDSARDIAQQGERAFVAGAAEQLGGPDVARATFNRSAQVHHAALALATGHLVDRAAPEVFAVPRGGPLAPDGPGAAALAAVDAALNAADADADVRTLPTLETLFGPLDAGACEECESVLSPAAYLVDLLDFLDASPAMGGRAAPLPVLLTRRPDLQHIQLSCENTEIELPYVDVANEILEHVVVNASIDGYTGHDIEEGTSSAALLATPQFVDDRAYSVLRAARYPAVLPWDQRLAALRAYLRQAGTTLSAAMTVLAEDAAAGRTWSDTVRERLGIGPAERDVLCGAEVTPQEVLGDDPTHVNEGQLVQGAANARKLARRLEIPPADLIALLRTNFVNPDVALLGLLGALRVDLPTIARLHDGSLSPAGFRALLPAGLDPAPYDGDVVAWLAARHDRIMNLIVLTDPTGQEPQAGDSTGGFAALELRRARPDASSNQVRGVDLLGIARFVRLRTRLGLSIERTDEVVTALWPTPPTPPTATADVARHDQDAGFAAVLVRLGHLAAAAELLDLDLATELPWLLGCCAPLRADGPDSAFRLLFPTGPLAGADPVFGPGPDGLPPAQPGATLLAHGPALQAAFKLTAGELDLVVRAAKVDDTTPLTVATLSAVFRYGYLARVLRLGVADLVAVLDATGWNPFAPPDGAEPDLLRVVRFVVSMRDCGLPAARLAALALGRGVQAAADPAELALLRGVRAALVDPAPPAGGTWTEAALRSLLSAAFAPDVVDRFLGLLAGATAYSTSYHQEAPDLPAAVLDLAPALSYDGARSLLLHAGVLAPSVAAAVAALPGLPAGLADAVTTLANAGQADYLPLFWAHPQLQARWLAWVAAADPDDPSDVARLAALGAGLLDDLRPLLRRRRLADAVAAATATDAATISALVDDPGVAAGSGPGASLGDDLAAVATPGLTARFWAGPVTGAPVTTGVADQVDYGPGRASLRAASEIAAGPIGGEWSAVVDPPVSGAFTLSVETDAVAVTLTVNGAPVAGTRTGAVWTATAPVDLVAGAPVPLVLTAAGLDARLALRWQAAGVGQVGVPGAVFFPAAAVAAFTTALRGLRVALELSAALGLSTMELVLLARSFDLRVDGGPWLSAIPVGGIPTAPDPARPARIVTALTGLVRYRALRERWGGAAVVLVGLLDGSTANEPDGPEPTIGRLAGSNPDTVHAAAIHLGVAGDGLRHVDALTRLADVLDLTRRVVLPVPTLAAALRSTPSAADVAAVRDALRARYDEAAWASVVRPIHDELRRGARDALVGRVLHQQNPDPDLGDDPVTGGFISAEQLFETLLVDVQMDPCMTTSRIVSAISTVQLFVARCLLNLEPEVAPNSIDAPRWEAMKQYRVWEANRKVFLFPENWLDPELRDDKSPFFRDVESELLQSDITDQVAAIALGHYLENLDDVANLEIAGMHVIERDAAGTGVPDPIVHVVGRTAGAKRGYYHRVLDGTWLPWEQVNVDIQDDPVLPVIWQGRFLLFWLKIAKQPDPRQPGPFDPRASTSTRLGDLAVSDLALRSSANLTVSLFWSEYYNGRWQSPRTSDPDRPIDLGAQFDVVGDPLQLRLASEIETDPTGVRDSLGIIVLNPSPNSSGNSHFRLYTTHTLPVRAQDDTMGSPGFPADRQFSSLGPLLVTYGDDPFHPLTVLHRCPSPYRGVGPMHRLADPHRAPFFFEDSRHVFYVHPDPTDPVPPHPFGIFPDAIAAPAGFAELARVPGAAGPA